MLGSTTPTTGGGRGVDEVEAGRGNGELTCGAVASVLGSSDSSDLSPRQQSQPLRPTGASSPTSVRLWVHAATRLSDGGPASSPQEVDEQATRGRRAATRGHDQSRMSTTLENWSVATHTRAVFERHRHEEELPPQAAFADGGPVCIWVPSGRVMIAHHPSIFTVQPPSWRSWWCREHVGRMLMRSVGPMCSHHHR